LPDRIWQPWPVPRSTTRRPCPADLPAHGEEFLSAATGHDIAGRLSAERRIVERRYPETRRTWLKFADGHYSGANLFALRGEGRRKRADACGAASSWYRKKVLGS
jgi:hypothetical protein